jgi:hypothetical protein
MGSSHPALMVGNRRNAIEACVSPDNPYVFRTSRDVLALWAAPDPVALWSALARFDSPSGLVEAVIGRGHSHETRRAYIGDLNTFGSWLDSRGLRWRRVTPAALEAYRGWLARRHARSTVNRRLVVVRRLYGEAVRGRLLHFDPAEGLRNLTRDVPRE